MTRKEFIKFYGRDLAELKLTCTLNADIYNKMDKGDISQFIVNDVDERAKKTIHKDWTDEVNVLCYYTVIDSMYNIVDRITCHLKYSHELGSRIENIVYNSIT